MRWPWETDPNAEIDEAESETESVFTQIDALNEQEQRVKEELNEVRAAEAAYSDEASIGSEKPDHLRHRDEILAAAERAEADLKVGAQLGAVSEEEARERREQITAKREKARKLNSKVPDLEEELEEVRQEKNRTAREGLEPQVRVVRARGRRLVEAAAALINGDRPLVDLYEEFNAAQQAYREAKRDLGNLYRIARGSDTAVNRRMKQRLEQAIAEPFRAVPPAASLGRLVADLLIFARKADSPWLSLFEDTDLGRAGGSVHHSAAVGATPDFLTQAQQANYHADTTL